MQYKYTTFSSPTNTRIHNLTLTLTLTLSHDTYTLISLTSALSHPLSLPVLPFSFFLFVYYFHLAMLWTDYEDVEGEAGSINIVAQVEPRPNSLTVNKSGKHICARGLW